MENKKINWLRMVTCAAVLCIIAVLLFSIYSGKLGEWMSTLSEEDEPNLVWLFEYVSAALPVLIFVIVAELFYMGKSGYVPIYTQIEKLAVFSAVAFFVFVPMLYYVREILPMVGSLDPEVSLGWLPEATEEVESVWDRTYPWFFSQIIPFIIVIVYHAIRIGSEKQELLKVDDGGDSDEDENEVENEDENDDEDENEEK